MPAPNLPALFAYEAGLETTWAAILTAAGLSPFPSFSNATKTAPYVDVELRDVKPTGHKKNFGGKSWYDTWNGTLVSRTVTVRGPNSAAQQSSSLGIIRAQAQMIVENWTPAASPYYALALFREANLLRNVEPLTKIDFTELHHSIVFTVRPEAWPA